MKRVFSATLSALIAILLGLSLEWILLTGSSPQEVIRASNQLDTAAAPTRGKLAPDFQSGLIFPQWGTDAYSPSNPNWSTGLKEMTDQTGAAWVEMTVPLYQTSFTSTTIAPSEHTPTPESVAAGIRTAKAQGFHVFVVPLLTVGATGWSGDIHPRTARWTQAWFDGYWATMQPYLSAAGAAGADQFAIGTEYEGLEAAAPSYWNDFIEKAHAVFPGALTYDMNWTAALKPVRSWFSNPYLTYLGVSEYRPLTTRPAPRDAQELPTLWHYKIQFDLDNLYKKVGKRIILSEIGYRNSADALYQPWQWDSTAPAAPDLQAAAYDAALVNVLADPNIVGIYFWGWSVPAFQPNWLPAAHVLQRWYTLPRDIQHTSADTIIAPTQAP